VKYRTCGIYSLVPFPLYTVSEDLHTSERFGLWTRCCWIGACIHAPDMRSCLMCNASRSVCLPPYYPQ